MVELLVKIVFFAFFIVIWALVIWAFVHRRKRDGRSGQEQGELEQLALGRGWSYTSFVPGGADRYCGAEPFPTKGVNLGVCDYIVGEFRGHTVCCFEYRKRPVDVDSETTPQMQYFTVFAVTMPTPVPGMIVRRPQALDGMFAHGKVVQSGIPAFDDAFRIITNNEPFARNVMGGSLAQFLPSDPRAKDAPLRFHGNELITWHRGRLRPQQIDSTLNYLCDVLDRIPAQAWHHA
jgi:hypothetical protein